MVKFKGYLKYLIKELILADPKNGIQWMNYLRNKVQMSKINRNVHFVAKILVSLALLTG